MAVLQTFRAINEIERKIIFNSLSAYPINLLYTLKKLKLFLYISLSQNDSSNEFPAIFLIRESQRDLMKKFNSKVDISSAGLYSGFIKKGGFYLSLEGAELLYNSGALSEIQHIYVNKKGEKSILYGNHILRSMISEFPSKIKMNELVLVFNELKELIALGLFQIKHNSNLDQKLKDIIALNLVDKGYYLRKNKKK